MDEEKQESQKPEICSIRIMFPVDTDEQALNVRKAIRDSLGDIAGLRIEFSLSTMPSRPMG